MFDINKGTIGSVAKLLAGMYSDVFSTNDMFLVHAPGEEFQVVLVLLSAGEVDCVLLDLFICEIIAVEGEKAVFVSMRFVVDGLVPVLALEGGESRSSGLLGAHLTISLYLVYSA